MYLGDPNDASLPTISNENVNRSYFKMGERIDKNITIMETFKSAHINNLLNNLNGVTSNDIDKLILNEMPEVKMIMQVHDELVFECPKENADLVMEKMKETMEQTVELKIPLIAEAAFGSNWNEAH